MPLTLYVGKPGTGKTIEVVAQTLNDLNDGRDIYTNFQLGSRVPGYMVPMCPVAGSIQDGYSCKPGPAMCLGAEHADHAPVDGFFMEGGPALAWLAARSGRKLREGEGFVADPRVTILESWEQVIAIRVARDAMGRAHKLRLERQTTEDENGDTRSAWRAVPTCKVWDCPGCSVGITIALDELNLWAPSRLWQEMPADVLNRWAYIRKDGLNIYASSQHESRIDIIARQVTNEIVTCKNIGPLNIFGFRFLLFTRQRWQPELLTEKGRTHASEGAGHGGLPIVGGMEPGFLGTPFHGFNKRAARAYDTYEHVRSSGHLEASSRKATEVRAMGQEPRLRITQHLAGKHDAKPARTCPVCTVQAELATAVASQERTTPVVTDNAA